MFGRYETALASLLAEETRRGGWVGRAIRGLRGVIAVLRAAFEVSAADP